MQWSPHATPTHLRGLVGGAILFLDVGSVVLRLAVLRDPATMQGSTFSSLGAHEAPSGLPGGDEELDRANSNSSRTRGM